MSDHFGMLFIKELIYSSKTEEWDSYFPKFEVKGPRDPWLLNNIYSFRQSRNLYLSKHLLLSFYKVLTKMKSSSVINNNKQNNRQTQQKRKKKKNIEECERKHFEKGPKNGVKLTESDANYIKKISEVPLLLTLSHILPIFLFSIPWYQKTWFFYDIFKKYR